MHIIAIVLVVLSDMTGESNKLSFYTNYMCNLARILHLIFLFFINVNIMIHHMQWII